MIQRSRARSGRQARVVRRKNGSNRTRGDLFYWTTLGTSTVPCKSLRVGIDAPIGTEQPIPEIVDYREIAISIPGEKMD
jgi:hypothetical protein